MERPDAEAVRAALPRFDWDGRAGPAADPDPLEADVESANVYVEQITWRRLDATMPAPLAAIALRAVALRTAQEIVQGEDDYVATVNDDAISSMTVGPYSETRRDLTKKGRYLNPWPRLDQLLWLLLSLVPGEVNADVTARYDYWVGLLMGVNAPAFELTEVDWTNGISGRDLGPSWGLPGPTYSLPELE